MAVTVRLEDDLDISRGDMICRPHNSATARQELDAMVCWMSDDPLVRDGSSRSSTRRGPPVQW